VTAEAIVLLAGFVLQAGAVIFAAGRMAARLDNIEKHLIDVSAQTRELPTKIAVLEARIGKAAR